MGLDPTPGSSANTLCGQHIYFGGRVDSEYPNATVPCNHTLARYVFVLSADSQRLYDVRVKGVPVRPSVAPPVLEWPRPTTRDRVSLSNEFFRDGLDGYHRVYASVVRNESDHRHVYEYDAEYDFGRLALDEWNFYDYTGWKLNDYQLGSLVLDLGTRTQHCTGGVVCLRDEICIKGHCTDVSHCTLFL